CDQMQHRVQHARLLSSHPPRRPTLKHQHRSMYHCSMSHTSLDTSAAAAGVGFRRGPPARGEQPEENITAAAYFAGPPWVMLKSEVHPGGPALRGVDVARA